MPSVISERPRGTWSHDSDVRTLVVSWEHPTSRAIEPVALLGYHGTGYTFEYLPTVARVVDFKPLLGFPELDVTYSSATLFPLFQQRVMDPKRPDYQRYVKELGIDGETTPWEQIYRSGGSREGDTLQLFPVPEYHDGVWTTRFLVHGIRHLMAKRVLVDGGERGGYSQEELEELLSSLSVGDLLEVIPEPANGYSGDALLVATRDRLPLGYVPHFLASHLGDPHRRGNLTLRVDHVNPPSAGWHMRLTAALEVVGESDMIFFDWQEQP